MGEVITLRSNGAEMVLDIGDNGWCRCNLRHPKNVYLGADSIRRIAGRIIICITNPDSQVGTKDTDPVYWVLSLAEAHCSLFVSPVGPNKRWYWQDGNGKQLCQFDTDAVVEAEWIAELNALVISD